MIVPTSVHISLTLYALKKMCEAIKEGEVRATFLNSLGQEVLRAEAAGLCFFLG